MKGKVINQHSLPKLSAKKKGAFTPIQFTVFKSASREHSKSHNDFDTLISQLGEYINNAYQSASKDLLQRCYIQFKRIRDRDRDREIALNQTLIQSCQISKMTVGGRKAVENGSCVPFEGNKENCMTEECQTENRSVLIRKVGSKKSYQKKSGELDSKIEDYLGFILNKSVISEQKEVKLVPSIEIINKLKALVRQKQAAICFLHEKIRQLTLRIDQLDISAKQQVKSLQRTISQQKSRIEEVETPVIEIDYPIEILEVIKSEGNSQMLEKYETICEDIEILKEQLNNRQEQSISLFRLLRQNQRAH